MSGRSDQQRTARTFEQVLWEELTEVETRREVAKVHPAESVAVSSEAAETESAEQRAQRLQLTGLALSGGGVRSAAYSLGVLQGLYHSGWLKMIDYLSTVSGGGYAGAYLSSSALGAGATEETSQQRPSREYAAPSNSAASGSAAPKQSRVERHLARALGDQQVQAPRIRQLLSSGGFLLDKILWLNRQLIGVILLWSVVLSGLVAFASLAAYLFRSLDYLAVRQLLQGLGIRDDLTLALFPSFVALLLYLICWTISYFKYVRLARGDTARIMLLAFLVLTMVAVAALIGNGDLSMDDVSQRLLGAPLPVDTQRQLEKWLPTMVYSFLGASLIPYLTPRRLFRSGQEGATSLEQLTFNLTSAGLVYGVPFLLVAMFARENVSLYAQRRIPLLTLNDFRDTDKPPAAIFRRIDAEHQAFSTQNKNAGPPAGYHLHRELDAVRGRIAAYLPDPRSNATKPGDATKPGEANKPGDATSGIDHQAQFHALRFQPSGTANEVAEAFSFHDPRSEISWGRRFRHFLEYMTSFWASDRQGEYEYALAITHAREESRMWEWQSHALNQLLIDPRFPSWFPREGNADRIPKWWTGTDAEWAVYRQAREHAEATSQLAREWKQRRWKEFRHLISPTAPADDSLPANTATPLWLYALVPTEHLRKPDRVGKYTPQETCSEWQLRCIDHDNRGLVEKIPSLIDDNDEQEKLKKNSAWNKIAFGENDLNELDQDEEKLEGHSIKATLVAELRMIKQVVDANRSLLEAYYPKTLEPKTTVFSYVVLEEDQKARLHWFWFSSAVFLIMGFAVHLNATSWHGYYARQIAHTWIEPASGLGSDFPLAQLETTPHGLPYHLLSGTLNSFRTDLDNPRQASLFLFSRLFCGADQTGFLPTSQFDQGKFRFADAVAVSGGAFSPMRERNPLRRALQFLGNFRLGQWVDNPAFCPSRMAIWEKLASCWPVTPLTFLWTFFRQAPIVRQRYVFVTDGGGVDNLGLEPLLRRCCRLIILVDATEDPDFSFAELVRVTTWMSNLHQIKFEWISPESAPGVIPKQVAEGGHPAAWQPVIPSQVKDEAQKKVLRPDAARHWLLARIEYQPGVTGHLLYLKSNVCAHDAPELIEYQRTHGPFPHDPTSDLVFEADQFEAYRRLGQSSIAAMIREASSESGQPTDLVTLINRMSTETPRPAPPITSGDGGASRDTEATTGAACDWSTYIQAMSGAYVNEAAPAQPVKPMSEQPVPEKPESRGSTADRPQPATTDQAAVKETIILQKLDRALERVKDKELPLLERKKSASLLAKYPTCRQTETAINDLERELDSEPDIAHARELRYLLIEFGPTLHAQLRNHFKISKGKSLHQHLELGESVLLRSPDGETANEMLDILKYSPHAAVRRQVIDAIKSLPYGDFSEEFWTEFEQVASRD